MCFIWEAAWLIREDSIEVVWGLKVLWVLWIWLFFFSFWFRSYPLLSLPINLYYLLCFPLLKGVIYLSFFLFCSWWDIFWGSRLEVSWFPFFLLKTVAIYFWFVVLVLNQGVYSIIWPRWVCRWLFWVIFDILGDRWAIFLSLLVATLFAELPNGWKLSACFLNLIKVV